MVGQAKCSPDVSKKGMVPTLCHRHFKYGDRDRRHVNHTREVGGIMITKTENKGRINKRLEIVLADE